MCHLPKTNTDRLLIMISLRRKMLRGPPTVRGDPWPKGQVIAPNTTRRMHSGARVRFGRQFITYLHRNSWVIKEIGWEISLVSTPLGRVQPPYPP